MSFAVRDVHCLISPFIGTYSNTHDNVCANSSHTVECTVQYSPRTYFEDYVEDEENCLCRVFLSKVKIRVK